MPQAKPLSQANNSHGLSINQVLTILNSSRYPLQANLVQVITPSQLHHLLRLSALPLPKSPAEEQSMIATLQSQLQFARAVQKVDTKGVEPLRAIRDETEAAVKEMTIGLKDLEEVLAKETLVGHYQRPRRAKERIESDAENWDALATASRKAGKYFVVESGKKAEAGEP
ncbi:hypothetical protein THAR02_06674 [Trichoderma harzianum]|uniref:Glutamyl-tRNA amidotransferase complex subunit Gta3 domain-containing protein n=1 Tax=Trichoderma harzianum TaxID=5544 RepID=A0A0F9X7R3_TRIHA|nr:hypothetical protein THAR02_06674 [Trichoderma harzianum]